MSQHYKAQDFIKAIDGSGGNVTVIASRVGCARNTVYVWLEKYPTVKEAFENEREGMIDHAESLLFKKMNGFTEKVNGKDVYFAPDTTALIFYLKTIARDRGYIEKQETEQSGSLEIVVKYDRPDSR